MGAALLLSDYVAAERERITRTLFEWLRIPSISAHPDRAGDVMASADFTADLLAEAGLEHAEVLETAGAPAVYADHLHAGAGAPTVLVYGHHDVQPVDPLDEWTSPPFDEAAWMATAGVRRPDGEAGRSTLERVWTRPTAEVVGLRGGYTGDGMKTIVPATANVKVTFRLVPDQRPAVVADAFRAWLAANVPGGIEVDARLVGDGVAPALTPVDHPAVGALGRAIERVWGRPPLYTREGGSGPEEALGRVLDAPVLFLGVGLPGDRIHAPNERLVMDQFWKGLLAAAELWHELGATNRG